MSLQPPATSSSPLIDQSSGAASFPCLPAPVRITDQAWPEGTVPLLSVFSWTYNHAQFIRESIESILMQETTFPVEIIIHDDASNDGTAEIIREYEGKYPQLFRNILQKENQWSQGKNVMDSLFSSPLGEFIALSHGDDYWISPSKIENQVMQLIGKPFASFCFHNTLIIDESRIVKGEICPKNKSLHHSLEELFENNFIHTSSIIFRKSMLPIFPDILKSSPMGDWPLCILLAENGSFLYLDNVMSHYRLHDCSSWSAKTQAERSEKTAIFFELLLEYFKDNKSILEYVLKGYIMHRKNSAREFYLLTEEKNSQIEILKSKLESLKNSKIWRFSWPIRLIDEKLKNHF